MFLFSSILPSVSNYASSLLETIFFISGSQTRKETLQLLIVSGEKCQNATTSLFTLDFI